MKSDIEVWKEGLDKEENEDLFKTTPGGKNSKPLENVKVFKTPKEKKLEEKIKKLEDDVKNLIKEVNKLKIKK